MRGEIIDGAVYYTVDSVNRDYALMTSSGVEDRVAMFLLPEGATVGSCLVREIMEWSLPVILQ